MVKKQQVQTTSRKVLLFLVLIVIFIALLFFPIINIPWGGAEDKNGDGMVDTFWDGYKRVSLFQYLTGRP